jgi:hypothetical protein
MRDNERINAGGIRDARRGSNTADAVHLNLPKGTVLRSIRPGLGIVIEITSKMSGDLATYVRLKSDGTTDGRVGLVRGRLPKDGWSVEVEGDGSRRR